VTDVERAFMLTKVEPRLMTLAILAAGLGVTIDEFIAGLPMPAHCKPSPQEQRKGRRP
jgi:hypothetical protein